MVLLSHRYWQQRFGADPTVVERVILLDGQKYRVVGVLPGHSKFNGRWIYGCLSTAIRDRWTTTFTMESWRWQGLSLVRLCRKPAPKSRPSTSGKAPPIPIRTRVGERSYTPWRILPPRQMRATLLVLFAAVGLVLLIACANIANLLLARNAAREREMALRTALGAASGRLVRQLLTESLLLSLSGGATGLLLASAGIQALGALAPAELSLIRETHLDVQVLTFTISICLAAGILCGLLPAVRARIRDLNGILKQGGKGASAPGSHRVHNTLVVAEIALALVPLIGAGLLLQSFRRLLDVAPGFQTDHVLSLQITQAEIPPAEADSLTDKQQLELAKKQSLQFDQILQRVSALPGVKASGGISNLPLGTRCVRLRDS